MSLEYTPHTYVYVTKSGLYPAYKSETKGLFKKKLQVVEFPDTIEMLNNGIRNYGVNYVGTYDYFFFDKPKPIRILSKTSYDELVRVFRWRHKYGVEKRGDYDDIMLFGKSISGYSLLMKKFEHVRSELLTMYPNSNDPNDPDYEIHKNSRTQFGPPYIGIGPGGKPFGDFKMRLVYDNILFFLYNLHWSKDKKYKKNLKPLFFKMLGQYQNFTKLPEFGLDELNEIIGVVR
jgi:hypothetical protein